MEPELRQAPLRFYELDLLRFLAAVSVMVYHYTYRAHGQGDYSPVAFPELGAVTRYGWLGVELFFIISGYVVLMSAYHKSIRQFFTSRVTRLYPAYWVACTVTFLVVSWLAPHAPALGWQSFRLTNLQYLCNLTMLQGYLHVENIDTSYWSLKYEITFYVFIALVIVFRLFKHLLVVLVLWLLYTAIADFGSSGPLGGVPKYSPYFISGMLFFLIQNHWAKAPVLYGLLACSFALALRSMVAETLVMGEIYHEHFSFTVAVGAVTTFHFVFWLVITRRLNLQRFTWLSTVGALTYPLYLLHGNVGFIVFRETTSLNKYAVLVALMAAMLLAAHLVHRYIERPLSKRLGRRLAKLFDSPALLKRKSISA